MSPNLEERFRPDLLAGERIHWTGQPDPSVLFDRGDLFLVPFSLLWGGFAIFWEVMALRADAPPFFALFGLPFVAMGLYFIAGRFFYKRWKKHRTFYAVTDRRVLVVTDGGRRNTEAMFIRAIPSMNRTRRSNGVGSIWFGNTSGPASLFSNTGMGRFMWPYAVPATAFHDVKDVDTVYQLVARLRDEASQAK